MKPLGWLVGAGCLYELVALAFGRPPTISRLVQTKGQNGRTVAVVFGAFGWVTHHFWVEGRL